MNPFYDISDRTSVPDDGLQLPSLGCYRTSMSIGYLKRDGWGGQTWEKSEFKKRVTEEDYDNWFVRRLLKSKPIYNMVKILDHHFNHYCSKHPEGEEDFLKHMRYVALAELKRKNNRNTEICVALFEKWLEEKSTFDKQANPQMVNNHTINIGSINSPTQIQQNSNRAVQTQDSQIGKEELEEFFGLIRKDIRNMDQRIRKDFGIEMDYAIAQLEKGKDIKPQLSGLGEMIKDIGVGAFSGLLGSLAFEKLKPLLGIQ